METLATLKVSIVLRFNLRDGAKGKNIDKGGGAVPSVRHTVGVDGRYS